MSLKKLLAVGLLAVFSAQADEEIKKDEDISIAVVSHFAHVPAWVPVQKGIDDAAEKLGIEVQVSGPTDFSLSNQVTTIQGKIAARVDGIVTTLPDPQAFNDVVEEATGMGIPVISMNADAPESKRLAYIGQSNYNAGYQVGKELVRRTPEGGKVMIGLHSLGASNLEERVKGIKTALDEHGKHKYQIVETTMDMVRASGLIGAWYHANPDAIAMLGVEEVSGTAINSLIEREELQDKVIGASFDLVEDVVNGIKEGTMKYTVDQQLYQQGYLPIVQMYLKIKYDINPSDIDTGATIISMENIERVAKLASLDYR